MRLGTGNNCTREEEMVSNMRNVTFQERKREREVNRQPAEIEKEKNESNCHTEARRKR